MNIISLFGKRIRRGSGEPDIRFHEEALHHVVHGYVIASHKQKGIRDDRIAFAVVGCSAPDFTLGFMLALTEAARVQGYVIHRLDSYVRLAAMPLKEADVAQPVEVDENFAFRTAGFDQATRADRDRAQREARVFPITKARRGAAAAKFGSIAALHRQYADMVNALQEDDREALEHQIDQIMRDARVQHHDPDVVRGKLEALYASYQEVLDKQQEVARAVFSTGDAPHGMDMTRATAPTH